MLIDQQFFLVISLILVFSLVRQLNFSNFTFTFILKVFNNFSLVDQNTWNFIASEIQELA